MVDLRGRRVLVTGAGGFVGASVVRALLHHAADVHALVRPTTNLWRLVDVSAELSLHRVDLVDFPALAAVVQSIQPQLIVHLATDRRHRNEQDRRAMVQTNIVGTFNVLEAMSTLAYERLVYVGSATEYGPYAGPLRETDPPAPVTLFGATKAAATLLCQQYARESRQPIMVLRAFSVYGPWQARDRLIPAAIRAAVYNERLSLTTPGYHRDWIFIDDLVDACLLALGSDSVDGKLVNIGSGSQASNETVVALIQDICGRPIRCVMGTYAARLHDRAEWVADIQRAKQWLNWEPRYDLRAGLEKTVAWFLEHPEVYAVSPRQGPGGEAL